MVDLNYFRKLLNVAPNTSRAELKQAYRLKSKQWHTKRFSQDTEQRKLAEIQFKEITIAYEHLLSAEPKENASPKQYV